jgi:hypothetical protein
VPLLAAGRFLSPTRTQCGLSMLVAFSRASSGTPPHGSQPEEKIFSANVATVRRQQSPGEFLCHPPDDLAGLVHVGLLDVQMRDRTDPGRAGVQHQHTLLLQRGGEVGGHS